jgi:hypothetical protein
MKTNMIGWALAVGLLVVGLVLGAVEVHSLAYADSGGGPRCTQDC